MGSSDHQRRLNSYHDDRRREAIREDKVYELTQEAVTKGQADDATITLLFSAGLTEDQVEWVLADIRKKIEAAGGTLTIEKDEHDA